jgi:acyl transferase domain-containing protein/acyl-CoA synthetase (AMP-forming)/AMP-acid ligase II/SAM-dependent methyltransferase/acyl carrier protein
MRTLKDIPAAESTLIDSLRRRARGAGVTRGYTFLADDESEARLTFTDLEDRSRRLAAELLAIARPGDRAILFFPPGLEFLKGLFGCLQAGLIGVPVAYQHLRKPNPALASIVGDSAATVMITTGDIVGDRPRFLSSNPELGRLRWVSVDDLAGVPTAPVLRSDPEAASPINGDMRVANGAWTDLDQVALLQYTSGSTGSPKGVCLTHRAVSHNLWRMRERLHLVSDDGVGVCWLPAYHDMGLIGHILQAVYSGWDLVLMSPLAFVQKPVRWLKAISRYRATITCGPNFAFDLCTRQIKPSDCGGLDLRSWQVACVGAEPIASRVLDGFTKAFEPFGFRREVFYPCYGLAESTLMVTGGQWQAPPVVRSISRAGLESETVVLADPGDSRGMELVGCGQPIPDLEVRIVDPLSGQPCAPDRVGEIWVGGPSVAAGYWSRPDETKQVFHARIAGDDSRRYLRTGDLGFFLDGELFVAGRLKDVIIVRGRKIYPQDIEQVVTQAHPALIGCDGCAFAVEVGEARELVLIHEMHRRHDPADREAVVLAIQRAIADTFSIAANKVALVRFNSLPRTTSGKLRRQECRRVFLAGELEIIACSTDRAATAPAPAFEGDCASPRRPLRRTRLEIRRWLVRRLAEHLKCNDDQIDPARPFAGFGLDSVTMVGISGELQSWLGMPVSPTLLYDAPNIEALSRALAAVEEEQHPAPAGHGRADREPIAVVGVGCRFPGAASPDEFWQLLSGGIDAVGGVPEGRWPRVQFDVAARSGGFLESVDRFDAAFFGIAPREAAYLDPQHRLLLEVSWEALEHAGLPADGLAGQPVGVFVGISSHDYARILAAGSAIHDAYTVSGNSTSMAASRLSYHFDFRGPSLAVDTACSSSLVAVALACESLRRGECRVALAGGVNLILTPDVSIALGQAKMLSPSGRCRAFDASADGYVRGEGCAVIVLKPLSQAINDGNRVLALLLGGAVNQDGKSNGITAPSGEAQAALIRAALADAGVAAEQVSYVEAHGTGTVLGDPIEFSALRNALSSGSAPCAVSTVKTNIGHLESAAGIAGLIKAVLQLQKGAIAPHLHLKALNPLIDLKGTRFFIPSRLESWAGAPLPRIAGVSSFGFGGSNAHVVVAEAPRAVDDPRRPARCGFPLVLSAQSESALEQVASRYHDFLIDNSASEIADVTFTASAGRSHRSFRLAVNGKTTNELASGLAEFLSGQPSERFQAGRTPGGRSARIAFLFTGQGSQRAGMGRMLYEICPPFRDSIASCEAALDRLPERPRGRIIDPAQNDPHHPRPSEWSQLELFATELALAETWRAWGVEPAAVLGHSLGEYVAACVAGVFSLEDGLRLVAARARLMDALPDCGAMAAVMAPFAQVEKVLRALGGPVDVAAINGSEQTVVSGHRDAIRAAREAFRRDGITSHSLSVTRAFHSHLIEPILDDFESIAATVRFQPPRIPVISNVSGRPAGPEFQAASYWRRQAREPVRFQDGLESLKADGFTVFLEIGPNATLSSLGRSRDPAGSLAWLSSLRGGSDEWSELLDALGGLYVRGFSIDWKAFYRHDQRRLISLPTYPFERGRHWVEIPETSRQPVVPSASERPATRRLDPARWVPRSRWELPTGGFAARSVCDLDRIAASLVDHDPRAERVEGQENAMRNLADRFAAAHVMRAFRELAWSPCAGDTWTTERLAERLGIKPFYIRLLGRMLEMLAEDGWLVRDGDRWQSRGTGWHHPDPSDLLIRLLEAQPSHEAELILADLCGRQLAAVLRGEIDPLSILFPGGSPHLLTRIYANAPAARAANRLIADTIGRGLAGLPAERIVRIVEIGAGTGGTTGYILPKLAPGRCEYIFTDISSLLLEHARDQFREHRFIQYRSLDIERDPVEAGFAPHQFDIVLAANVLHATGDLKRSLANIRRLLAPRGWLILLEGTGRERILDLVFGLTAGWWKFADLDLRPDYPLISRESWLTLLASMGFRGATAVTPAVSSQQIVFLGRAPATVAPWQSQQVGEPKSWKLLADREGIADGIVRRLQAEGGRCNVVDPHALALSGQPLAAIATSEPHAQSDSAREPLTADIVVDLSCLDEAESPGALTPRPAEESSWVVTRGQTSASDLLRSNVRWVDIDPNAPLEASLDLLSIELLDPGDEPFVAFRDGQRYVAAREAAAMREEPADQNLESIAALRGCVPADRCQRIQSLVCSELARTLRLPAHSIDLDRPMVSFGLDSLMAIQLKNRVENLAGVSVSMAKLLEGLTPAQLVVEIDQAISAEGQGPGRAAGARNGHHDALPRLETSSERCDCDSHGVESGDGIDELSELELDLLIDELMTEQNEHT